MTPTAFIVAHCAPFPARQGSCVSTWGATAAGP